MFAALVVLTALASPRAAVPNLAVIGLDAKYGEFLTEHLAAAVRESGVQTVTSREIGAVLGLERQRQLLGCTESGSCMAELAAALGSDDVVLGDIAQLDRGTYQVNLKVVEAGSGQVIATRRGRVTGEAALLDALSRAGYELGRLLPGNTLTVTRSFARTPLRGLGIGLGAAGLVAIAVGVGFSFSALDAHQALTKRELSLDQAQTLVAQGKLGQSAGLAALVGGGVALAAGLILFFVRDDTPLLTVLETLSGGGLSWQ